MNMSDEEWVEAYIYCICIDCRSTFFEPTNGGACPGCGSSNWAEPFDEIYPSLISDMFMDAELETKGDNFG